jgi:RNA-binding protein 26
MDPEVATGMPISQPMIGKYHTFGRGRGRGHFTGEAHSFHGERRSDKTLVVEKIPEDKLSLDAVNGWFKRFGTVTNVAVDASNAKALVSFSKHEEAHAAWKSEDAVFNNRFVKIFWHRPMEGHGQVGARMLAASAPVVASMAAKGSATDLPVMPAQSVPLSTPLTPPATSTPSSVSALAAKQRLLELQIAEQKSLMAKLSTSNSVERKEIMSRLRNLGEEMTSPTATVLTTDSTASAPAASTDDSQQQQRERLDRELEIHNATSAAPGEAGNSTEDLKAKLEKLKAEVTLDIYSSLWGKDQLLFLRLSGWESPTPRENPYIQVGRIDRIEVGVEERVDTFVERGVAP